MGRAEFASLFMWTRVDDRACKQVERIKVTRAKGWERREGGNMEGVLSRKGASKGAR